MPWGSHTFEGARGRSDSTVVASRVSKDFFILLGTRSVVQCGANHFGSLCQVGPESVQAQRFRHPKDPWSATEAVAKSRTNRGMHPGCHALWRAVLAR
jgi:hypothetical protein